ncbi:hypothetical protein PB2503_05837 [Parvularcula bermudensis HTCC2503]|uniref:Type I restriction modification DNA specificity domain-containing protein n=1 Tax=Parvularcula bermudensis (strain ATCC BAA-594 / HTCC2503 / KCTC 12087) TaxID=314260 RepID=E0TGZ8_PARBH|nr:restriction endonuclease subunit S [Parvularcula bermudensis]ADM09238.1 hypothetical protein PB2503_05837 [Parvularcula bermudensis HTCC2503]
MTDDAIIFESLGRAAEISAGYPLRGSAEALKAGDVHFLALKDVSLDADIDWAHVPTVELPSKRTPDWLSGDDVIFSARGTRTLAYPINDPPARAVCAPQFYVIKVKRPEKLLPAFLAWQINQKPAQDYFSRTATGSYIQNIRRKALENLPLAIPPVHEQQVIVEFWRAAQRERAVLNQLIQNRNQQLDALAVGLLHTRLRGAQQ